MSDPRFLQNDQELTRLYEAEKQTWIALHPEATSEEYEQAIRKIAEKIGF